MRANLEAEDEEKMKNEKKVQEPVKYNLVIFICLLQIQITSIGFIFPIAIAFSSHDLLIFLKKDLLSYYLLLSENKTALIFLDK
jgi:hypothetical protein